MNKKKVLISQPMGGLSTEQIKANREQAVDTFNKKYRNK